jgi:hypothetical protein
VPVDVKNRTDRKKAEMDDGVERTRIAVRLEDIQARLGNLCSAMDEIIEPFDEPVGSVHECHETKVGIIEDILCSVEYRVGKLGRQIDLLGDVL